MGMTAARRFSGRRHRYALLLMLGALLFALASGAVRGAQGASTGVSATVSFDAIAPSPVALTLDRGASATVDATAHLNAAPPKADILIALDTTGSMGAAIADARADAAAIVTDIHSTIPNARFALADFKDYPNVAGGGFGQPTDYAWRVDQDFTTDATAVSCGTASKPPIECALEGLTAPAGSGGDNAESYNRAFYEAYAGSGLNWASGA